MTASDKTVSVIIPTYNSENYIARCINSILNQSYSPIEIIIIDDCSQDATIQLVKSKYPNVKIIKNSTNLGAGISRNKGIKESIGDYIAFCDSDDFWEKSKVEEQINQMHLLDNDFSYTSYRMINEKGKIIINKSPVYNNHTLKDQLISTRISTSSVLVKKTLLERNIFSNRRTGQDYHLWLRLLLENNAIGIDKPLTNIFRRNQSLSSNTFQSIKDVWEIQSELIQNNFFIRLKNCLFYLIDLIYKRIFL